MTTGRRKARREAVFALYQGDLMQRQRADVVGGSEAGAGAERDPYQQRLIEGVLEHRQEIDAELAARLEGWTLERLAPLERNILRVGAYEVRWVIDTPAAVAVAEAVALAKRYCSDEAGRLVNGVLGALVE
ncbi:MAG TPA: transcription antitermination factor NusB [Thermoleophilia bacterium]|nr:transcription antitermination factor NusB [Thermoleophilia bacterium]